MAPNRPAPAAQPPRVGFIFDCDGTLLDSMDVWINLETTLAARAGATLTREQRDLLCGYTTPEECAWFHRELGLGESPDDVRTMVDEILMDFYANKVTPRKGAVELIAALTERGIPCTIASSSPHPYLKAGLERAGIYDAFTAVLSVDDAGAPKRERRIFDMAADAMGTTPETTWGVDDAVYALRTLASAGFRTIGIYDSDGAGTIEQLRAVADIAVLELSDIDIDAAVARIAQR